MVTSVCLHNAFTTCMSGAQGGQKRISDALELVTNGCKLSCGYWELNMGPLTRATSTLNCQAISPVPHWGSKKNSSTTLTLYVCVCVRACTRVAPQEHTQDLHVEVREQLQGVGSHLPLYGSSLRQEHPVVFSLERDRGRHPPLTFSKPSFQQTVSVA